MKYYNFLCLSLCMLSFRAVAQYKPEYAYLEPAVRCQLDPIVMEKMIEQQEANNFDADNSKVVCARAYAEKGDFKKVNSWIAQIRGAGAKRWAISEAAQALVAGKRFNEAEQLVLPYIDTDPRRFDTIYPNWYLRQSYITTYGVSILYSYAAVLYQKGDYTNGIKYFKKAEDAQTSGGFYHAREEELGALLLMQTGNRVEAIKRMRVLLSWGINRPAAFLSAAKDLFTTYYFKINSYQQYVDSITKSNRQRMMAAVNLRQEMRTMPDVLLKDMKGNDFSLKSLRGKTVFVYMWSLPETNFKDNPFAEVQRAKEYYAKDTNVVFICIHSSENIPGADIAAKQYLESRQIDLPLYIDPQNFEHPNKTLAHQLAASESGQWLFLDRGAKISWWTRDLRPENAFESIKAYMDATK